MIANNVVDLLPHNIDSGVSHTYFNIKNAGIYFGIGGYAYEAAATFFTGKPLFTF
jgi:hypothetical protein